MSWVYVLEGAGLYKIGVTAGDIRWRVRSIQAASPVPLRLVGVMRGTEDDEALLHSEFGEFWDHAEWFALSQTAIDSLSGRLQIPSGWRDQPDTKWVPPGIKNTAPFKERITRRERMTEEIPVHVYFVLDRSGSMASIASDVIGGFNQFIEDQKAQEGECRISMIQFDSHNPAEVLYDAVPITEVVPLDSNTFTPRGSTPLLDAEGWMINRARERAAARREAGEPQEATLFVTFTDGMENASREWTKAALTAAKTQAEADGWAFTYLGCGHDAYGQASSIGTVGAATMDFAPTSVGIRSALNTVSMATSSYRGRAKRGMTTSSVALYNESDSTASLNEGTKVEFVQST